MVIWNLEGGEESHFVPELPTQAIGQGGGASVGREEMGDPSGDAEKTVDTVHGPEFRSALSTGE